MPISLGTTTITALYLGTTSITSAYLGATQVFGGSFTPLSLFSGGAQGIWLDPSDVANLDWRRNLLTYSEAFNEAVWSDGGQFSSPISANVSTSPVDTMTADRVTLSSATTGRGRRQDVSGFSSASSAVSVWVKAADTGSATHIRLTTNNTVAWNTGQSVKVALTTSWQRISLSGALIASGSSVRVLVGVVDVAGSVDTDCYGDVLIWGAQLETGSTATTYQRITDVNTEVLERFPTATMFSDRAGTILVTTPGTVVGKRLDKSGRGNHATAPTDAARPVYGVEPKGGRRNLLTWSEGFAAAPWVRPNITATAAAAVAPDGTMTATKLTSFAGFGNQGVFIQSAAFTWNGQTGSFYVKAGTASIVSVCSLVNQVRAYYDIGNETIGNTLNCTASITSVGDDWYRCECRSSSTGSGGYFLIVVEEALRTVNPNDGYVGTGKDLFIWGAQLELGSTATTYQRALSAYDITEAGVATCHYVQYDGSDDSMSTAAIDFTATDKMSVFAGVRKNVDTGTGIVVELGPATADVRAFNFAAPNAGSNYGLGLLQKVTPPAIYATGWAAPFVAPTTNVVTGLFDWAGAGDAGKIVGRVNAVAQTLVFTNRGGTLTAGNYGNYPLFIGRRNNATLPFNGRDFGIIVVGKAASAGEITDTETWLAAKTSGVTL